MKQVVNGIEVEMSAAEEIHLVAAQAAVIASLYQPPDQVSARQFKRQLLAVGLLDQVDAWIATQPRAVQIAYEYSGSFARTEPMMSARF